MAISRRDLESATVALRRHAAQAEREQAKKETYMGHLLQSGEIIAGAAASGLVSGRFGALSLGPIPADLVAAGVIHGIGFMGWLGKFSGDAHNLADGVLAAYFVKLGAGLGTEWRLRSGQSAFTSSGDGGAYGQMGLGNPAGGYVSDEQLAAMAAMA